MAIQTVAVIGASGNVGSAIVAALLSSGFTVTAITRPDSTATFSPGVQVRRADPSSFEQLKAALAGQDAVVSAAATAVAAGAGQDPLIDAAVAAGVRRFIPSEFGHSGHRIPDGEALKGMLAGKTRTLGYVKAKAVESKGGFSWTAVGTSMWFDWGLENGTLGANLKDNTFLLIDSGDEVWSVTSLPFVGRAVAAVLQKEEETKNAAIDIVEFQTTQNELLKALEAETGTKFTVTRETSVHLEKVGQENVAKGDYGTAFMNYLHLWAFTDGKNHAVPDAETHNGLLGLPAPSRDVAKGVREYLQKKKN